MDKKNVILLTLDTLRKDVLGCYGSDAGLTPFIDSLCEKSIRFTRCQAIAPYTQALTRTTTARGRRCRPRG